MPVDIKMSKEEKGEKEEEKQQPIKKAQKTYTHYLFHNTQPYCQQVKRQLGEDGWSVDAES